MKTLSLLLILISQPLFSQIDKNEELFTVLLKQDAMLFEKGFNQCQLEVSKDIVTEDLEFYHDQGGFQDKTSFLAAMKKNICSNANKKPIRKLIDESLEVFPLYQDNKLYAAIQNGIHEFYLQESDGKIYQTGIAKFTHLWVLTNNRWKLKRIFSFDHKAIDNKLKKLNAHYPIPLFDRDSGILKLLKKHQIPSVGIGVIKDGKIKQIRVFGEQKADTAASYDSIYKVASLTKPITALVALKLIDNGKLNLDEPLYPYHMDKDIAETEEVKLLTPRIVLSHQTGFPNWRYLETDNKLKFQFKPGSKYQYSGEGYEYLRIAIENKTGLPIEELANDLIFKPLNMSETHFYWTNETHVSRYAQEHDEEGKAIKYKKHHDANAAANLLTTVEDYSKFMVHILNGAGMSQNLYAEMINKQVNVKHDVDFGLGWEIYHNLGHGEFAIQHSGGDYGIKTLSILLPKSKRRLLIFTNSENGIAIWGKIIKEYFPDIGQKLIELNMQ